MRGLEVQGSQVQGSKFMAVLVGNEPEYENIG
jgi:hypothetical protein